MYWAIHRETLEVIGPFDSLTHLMVHKPEIYAYGPSLWAVVKEL